MLCLSDSRRSGEIDVMNEEVGRSNFDVTGAEWVFRVKKTLDAFLAFSVLSDLDMRY